MGADGGHDKMRHSSGHRVSATANHQFRYLTRFALATLAAGGLATATRELAAGQRLEVILSEVGGVPLNHCTVTAARPGRQVTRLVPTTSGNRHLQQQLLYTTVDMAVRC